MSTPEQPGTPPLTRRQLRDNLSTLATAAPSEPEAFDAAPVAASPFVPPGAPLARAAEPITVPEPPAPDASVDLGVSPLTRRQARQQERIRTASVPVITPEVIAAHAAQTVPAHAAPTPASSWTTLVEEPAPAPSVPTLDDLFALSTQSQTVVPPQAPQEEPVAARGADQSTPAPWAPVPAPEPEGAAEDAVETATGESVDTDEDVDASEGRAVVSPDLGAELFEHAPVQIDLPPSFDQLISRASSGSGASGATPKSLIVAQNDTSASIVAPVAATGEVLVTGTFNLPEGLGSLGHVPGTADGKEVDAVLVDGELPAHSSPTPIAASAAISTVKSAGEIIKPPAPEKGNKLMVSLAITAGVLAAALLGVLAVAMISGVF